LSGTTNRAQSLLCAYAKQRMSEFQLIAATLEVRAVVANCKRNAASLRKPRRSLAHSSSSGDEFGRKRNGRPRVQTFPQNVAPWQSLFGRHQQLLDGAQAKDDLGTLLTSPRGTGNAPRGSRARRLRFCHSEVYCSKCSKTSEVSS